VKTGEETIKQIQARRLTRPKRKRPLKPLKPKFPHTAERDYLRFMQKYVTRAKSLSDQIIKPLITALVREARIILPSRIKNDDAIDDLASAIARIKEILSQEFSDTELQHIALAMSLAVEIVVRTNAQNLAEQLFRNIPGKITLPPSYTDLLKLKAKENVQLIKTLPERHFASLQSSVLSAITQGTRVEDIEELIDSRFNSMNANAELIARDQVGKLNGQLTEMSQSDLGVTEYIWRTAGDDRVRGAHSDNNGLKFSWNNPPPTGHPGDDFQCRCYAEPFLEDLI
jgi:SPP1 gp7 family putative phage head morphogenesis protein